jgi:hypothetical protein
LQINRGNHHEGNDEQQLPSAHQGPTPPTFVAIENGRVDDEQRHDEEDAEDSEYDSETLGEVLSFQTIKLE